MRFASGAATAKCKFTFRPVRLGGSGDHCRQVSLAEILPPCLQPSWNSGCHHGGSENNKTFAKLEGNTIAWSPSWESERQTRIAPEIRLSVCPSEMQICISASETESTITFAKLEGNMIAWSHSWESKWETVHHQQYQQFQHTWQQCQ
jgi:hypothetical protein